MCAPQGGRAASYSYGFASPKRFVDDARDASITAAGYASSTCCGLQQCVSGAVSHPCMRLTAQLPGSLSHLPTNLFCNEWCAGSQRPASLGRPWGPLVPPARARYKSGRLRRRSSPVAATGDHQAVAQLQATLPRHGTPRPACPVRLVSTTSRSSDSSSSRKDTLGFQPAQQQPPPRAARPKPG